MNQVNELDWTSAVVLVYINQDKREVTLQKPQHKKTKKQKKKTAIITDVYIL